jgi:hypothetical protein
MNSELALPNTHNVTVRVGAFFRFGMYIIHMASDGLPCVESVSANGAQEPQVLAHFHTMTKVFGEIDLLIESTHLAILTQLWDRELSWSGPQTLR